MPPAASRGCDACRRQKKKVRSLIGPKGLVFNRLNACTGRDAIHYRFRHQFADESSTSRKSPSPPSNPRTGCPRDASRRQQPKNRPLLPLVKVPTNEYTHSIAGFISILEITDPRYDVSSMSHWLGDLPKRFGSNKALDSAMHGVIASFPCLYSKTVTERAVGAYEETLKYVRLSLLDPRANVDTEYGILELGISYTLKSAKSGRTFNEFERAVRRTLSVCIILECLSRPEISLDGLVETLKITEGPRPYTRSDGKAYTSLSVASLAKLPTLFQEPRRYLEHIKQDYNVLKREVPLLRQQLIELRDYATSQLAVGQTPAPALTRLISSVRAGYSLALSIQINFGSIVQTYEPNSVLQKELEILCGQALELAALVEGCRPIGSGVARLPMVAAWMVTEDPIEKVLLSEAMESLQNDAPESESWLSILPNMPNWIAT
ncbi:hypothetical protein NLG97_g8208 [Lecanicillium saksenae]|uniref:Uncharacterized protein n=1 Tax=Lecanicillium saksenae TaxID=468837 RepID=A0ACC1QLI3_9HYPO|nr:hypothetical protein NLG97_g8208 [Lecanicillium saksenae]